MSHAHQYKGPCPMYRGQIAVRKRLAAAGLAASKIEMYRGMRGCWEADTNRGKRWVSHSLSGGWTISKTPPAEAA